MGNRRQHARLSRMLLGDLSLGETFQGEWLDQSSARLGPRHREVDHTWDRVDEVARLFGPVGYLEFLIHLGHDFGLVPDWDDLVGPNRH
jgi:hypothetical protein